jgi:hypothetical protein
MIVLALVVGAVTGWYLGIRAGVFAAVVSAAALLVASFVQEAAVPVLVLLGLWTAGVWFWKDKLPTLGKPKQPEKKGWEK